MFLIHKPLHSSFQESGSDTLPEASLIFCKFVQRNYFMPETKEVVIPSLSFDAFKDQLLSDYRIIVLSRECSLLGRKEALTGKAKFGIFGDGKELPVGFKPLFQERRF